MPKAKGPIAQYGDYEDYAEYTFHQAHKAIKTRSRTKRRLDSIKGEAIYLKVHTAARRVLCIGARDFAEVVAFDEQGFDAVGIDLAGSRGIIQCDMSQMQEARDLDRYLPRDIAYMSHSLEHCLDHEGLLASLDWIHANVLFIVVPQMQIPTKWDCSLYEFMLPDTPHQCIEAAFPGFVFHEGSTQLVVNAANQDDVSLEKRFYLTRSKPI